MHRAGHYRRVVDITLRSLAPRGEEQLRQALPPGIVAKQLSLNMWQRFHIIEDGFRRHCAGGSPDHDVPETEKRLSELSVAIFGIYHRYVDHPALHCRQRLGCVRECSTAHGRLR